MVLRGAIVRSLVEAYRGHTCQKTRNHLIIVLTIAFQDISRVLNGARHAWRVDRMPEPGQLQQLQLWQPAPTWFRVFLAGSRPGVVEGVGRGRCAWYCLRRGHIQYPAGVF